MLGFYTNRKQRRQTNKAADLSSPQPGVDAQGYIVSQTALANMYYGAQGSRKSGCGPICCYNLLRHFGIRANLGEIMEWFEKKELAGGDLGSSIFNAVAFLRKNGLECTTRTFPQEFPPEFLHADAIMVFYYGTTRGKLLPWAHFVCMLLQLEDGEIKRDPTGRPLFLIYNSGLTLKTADGEYRAQESSYEAFFKRGRLPAFVVAVNKK